MLDILTLRVAFGVIAICVLVLFYGATYRTSRSPYSGWWCVSLSWFVLSALLFLGNGTPAQVIANPLGNTLAVAGAGGTWAAARSLRERAYPVWHLAIAPAVVLAVSLLDDPRHDVWSGGVAFLVGMALGLGCSSRELWVLRRTTVPTENNREHLFAVTTLALASGVVAAYYLLRAGVFVALGPNHRVFEVGFGSQTTTLTMMALLVVVTFGMSALSHGQQTSVLREQATRDGLTGVLNRNELLRLTEQVFGEAATSHRAVAGAVMVADLDDFKALNDGFGHAAGDRALSQFAAACERYAGAGSLVGRLGGDEFVIVLPDGRSAETVAAAIRDDLRSVQEDRPRPTASFGIAPVDPAVGVKDTIVRADIALYRAKAAGRNRVVWYDEPRDELVRGSA